MSPEQLLAALDEPVFEVDAAGRVLYAAPALAAWVDCPVDAALAEAFDAADRGRFLQMLARISDGKTAQALIEVRLAGAGIPVEVKLSRGRREGDKVHSVAGWMRDITMEKAREAAANVQGSHLLDLVENIADACVVENAAGEVEMLNSAFCELFRIEAAPQSLVGVPCSELFEKAAAVTEKNVAPVYFPLDSAKADKFEFRFADTRRAQQHSMPVGSGQSIAGRLHIFHSLEASAAAPAVSAAVAAQSRMVERIARNLATVVEHAGSAIHRAEQLDLPGGVLEHFRAVEAAADAAFHEIAGLIDFNHIEASDLHLESVEFRLRESIASMLDNVVPDAERLKVQLHVSIEQDVPEFLIGDGARLMLVLRSLIEAGIPAAQGGDLSLLIEPEYSADNRIHVAFRVESAPPKGSARNKSATPTHQMQVALARQIVRAMSPGNGGRIETRERKETTIHQFTAEFPFRPGKDVRSRPAHVTLTAMPVLIVSADAEQRKMLTDLARTWRMLPREADSASVALQFLNRMAHEGHPLPLVITANTLPVQDGFLLGFRIRYNARLKQTAVMMLANSGKAGDAIACRENGISAYLRQPIAPNQINEAILAVMGAEAEEDSSTTLITRHSLREAKAGSVLVIDPSRDQS
ncbi:MAG TPA: PAS domain-containing protein, partial [Usitatibacteraceae bacterium]|nr:PAS domain-containing protein [Usitatibacteraceae bacterium]